MAITFPRELPDVGYATADVILRDGVAASPAASGLVNYTQVAPPVWEASLTTRPLVMSEFATLEAWWLSLRGGLRSVLFRHPHVCYPRAHWENHAPARTPGRLASISSGNALSIISVDPALILSAGDRIGLEHANRWYVGRVTEASGSGTTRVISVEPPPPSNIAQPGAVVRFDRPGLLMRPVPDSYQATRSGRHYSVSFRLVEVAGVGSVPRDMDFNFTSPLVAAPYFTRASSATYYGADGLLKTAAINEPRIDHDPVTREPLGLLIEEARTNSVFPSVPNAQWGATPASSLSFAAATAPDGSNTAVRFGNANAGASTQYIYRSFNGASYKAGTRYTAGFWIKAMPGVACPTVRVILHEAAFGLARSAAFNPSSPSDGVQPINSPEAYGVIAGGNGWYYLWVSHTATATVTSWTPLLWWATQNSNIDAAILCWGCQNEVGAFPTSYIPTTTTAATRAADQLCIAGEAFDGWYNPGEGTIFAEYSYNQAGNNFCPVSLDNGTSAQALVLSSAPTSDRFIVISNGITQFNTGFVIYTPMSFDKRAFAYRTDDFASVKGGGIVTTATGVVVPTPTQLCIGHAGYFSSSRINGHIKRVTYFPRRLSNAELQEITT